MTADDSTKLLLVGGQAEADKLSRRLKKLRSTDEAALMEAQKSLKRFTPVQPLMIPKNGGAMVFCAHCKRDLLRVIIERKHYCPYCGQSQTGLPVPGGQLRFFLPPDGEGGRCDG